MRLAPIDLAAQGYYTTSHGYEGMNQLFESPDADGVLLMDFKHYTDMELDLDKSLQTKIKMLFEQCSQLMDIRTYSTL